jgi:hypothetical protein
MLGYFRRRTNMLGTVHRMLLIKMVVPEEVIDFQIMFWFLNIGVLMSMEFIYDSFVMQKIYYFYFL